MRNNFTKILLIATLVMLVVNIVGQITPVLAGEKSPVANRITHFAATHKGGDESMLFRTFEDGRIEVSSVTASTTSGLMPNEWSPVRINEKRAR